MSEQEDPLTRSARAEHRPRAKRVGAIGAGAGPETVDVDPPERRLQATHLEPDREIPMKGPQAFNLQAGHPAGSVPSSEPERNIHSHWVRRRSRCVDDERSGKCRERSDHRSGYPVPPMWVDTRFREGRPTPCSEREANRLLERPITTTHFCGEPQPVLTDTTRWRRLVVTGYGGAACSESNAPRASASNWTRLSPPAFPLVAEGPDSSCVERARAGFAASGVETVVPHFDVCLR